MQSEIILFCNDILLKKSLKGFVIRQSRKVFGKYLNRITRWYNDNFNIGIVSTSI